MNVPSMYSPFRIAPVVSLLLAASTLLAPQASAQPGHTAGLAALDDIPGLIATVSKADAPVAARARACQLLSLTNSREAVAAVAPLLTDPVLAHYARTALEGIPDPAALDALRAALATTSGNLRIGIINSLGVRADPKAVPALAAIVREPGATGAAEALVALGRIATPDVAGIIRPQLTAANAALRTAAADAAVRLAEILAARGDTAGAAELCDTARKADVPAPFRLAALRGAILARGDAGLPMLLDVLRGTDPAQVALAFRVARELPGTAVSRALASELPRTREDLQPSLIRAIADRGDRATRGPIEALASSPDPAVRLASLEALGAVGDVSSIAVLTRALGAPDASAEVDAAITSLVRLPAGDCEPALIEALRRAEMPARIRLMTVFAQRGTRGAEDILLNHAGGADPAVAKAAFDAMAAASALGYLQPMIRTAAPLTDPAVRDRAERAIYSVVLQDPEPARRTRAIVDGLKEASTPAARSSLLEVLGMLGTPTDAAAVATAYTDPSPEVRETALQLLTHWSDTATVPALVGIFKSTSDARHRAAALQGIVTLVAPSEAAAKRNTPPSKETIAWITEVSAALRPSPEEKRVLISGLGDLNCREGLQLLAPHLEDAEVRTQAAEALIRMAPRLADAQDKAQAKALLAKVADGTAFGAETRRKAAEAQKAL